MTNRIECDIIKKLRDERPMVRSATHIEKKFEKARKKFLTNGKRCVNINQFAADARATAKSELTVPCKLNNVKTNYNTLDNYELFKFRVNEFKPTKILEYIC